MVVSLCWTPSGQGWRRSWCSCAITSVPCDEEPPGLVCWDLCQGGWITTDTSGKGCGIIKQLCLIVAHDSFQMLLKVIPDVFFGTFGCWEHPCLGRVRAHPLLETHVASLPFSLRHERSAALRNTPTGQNISLCLQCLCWSKSSQICTAVQLSRAQRVVSACHL